MSALPLEARRLVPSLCAAVDDLETAPAAVPTQDEHDLACRAPRRRRKPDEPQANYMLLGMLYLENRRAESKLAGDGQTWKWTLAQIGSVLGMFGSAGFCLLGGLLAPVAGYRHRTDGGVREDRLLRRLDAFTQEVRSVAQQVSVFCAQDVKALVHLHAAHKHALGVLTGVSEAVKQSPDTRVAGSGQLHDALRGANAEVSALSERLDTHSQAYGVPAPTA